MRKPPINPSLHRQLFQVTDKMRRLKTNPDSVTPEEYRDVLTEVCNSLTYSLDHGLQDALNFAQDLNANPGVRAEAKAVVREFDAFARFLEFENKALQECGVSPQAAQDIGAAITSIQNELERVEFDTTLILKHIEQGHTDICRAVEEATAFIDSEQQLLADKKRTMLTYGTALILANAAGIAITYGAAAPFLLLSSAGGGALIVWRSELSDKTKKAQ